jgi:hypothetical protein
MPKSLQQSATDILRLLAMRRRETHDRSGLDGPTISKITSIPPNDVNDAVVLLHNSGYVDWVQYLETVDYDFAEVWITPVGRYEAERVSGIFEEPLALATGHNPNRTAERSEITLPPTPIGSPYGFNDTDWEYIAQQKARSDQLVVVMGYQFVSQNYNSDHLQQNIRSMFETAVSQHNTQHGSLKTQLDFRPLAAGYGEHLFNEIARDIIASDIAVFDTSDLNSNVMIELGVALTWGIRVLPIKLHTQPRPPSDISGQTWAEYKDSAKTFLDTDHDEKLVRMVQRATNKKGRQRS